MQFGLDFVAYVESVDKFRNALLGDGGVDAGELLEGFVWLGVAFAAQNGLYAFGDNAPHVTEIAVDRLSVEQQFAEPFGC